MKIERRGDKVVLTLEGERQVDLRLSEADAAKIEEFQAQFDRKYAVHRGLRAAIEAFEQGRADYVNACDRLEDLYVNNWKSMARLASVSSRFLALFTVDQVQGEIVKGFFQVNDPEIAADAASRFLDIWRAAQNGKPSEV